MSELGFLRRLLERVANAFGFGRKAEFTCADCNMNERCGLPPSENCLARAAQISSGRGRPRIRDLSAPY